MTVRTNCLLCGSVLPDVPVIQFDALPYGAQNFPTAEALAEDAGKPFDVFQCVACGHVQSNSQPVIYQQAGTSATAFSQAMLDIRKTQIHNLVQEHGLKGKTLLDVGSGDGQTLHIIADAGAVPIGIEPAPEAVAVSVEQGFTAHEGYITRDYRLSDELFDGFVCYHVIEHVPDVRDFLQGIAFNMKPGAVGLVETPNFDQSLQKTRFYDIVIDHLSYFTLETLKLSAEMSGFDVLSIEKSHADENLVMIVRRRVQTDFAPMLNQRQSLQEQLQTFVQAHHANGKRVAIWGASYQTLTLLASLSFDKIAYVIDSAPYKQGRFTPVSHLPVVSPDALQHDPIDAIIISTSRYEDEILAQIETTMDFKGEIASLRGGDIVRLKQ